MSNQPRDAKMTLYRGQNSLGPNGAKMDFRAKTALSYLQCMYRLKTSILYYKSKHLVIKNQAAVFDIKFTNQQNVLSFLTTDRIAMFCSHKP